MPTPSLESIHLGELPCWRIQQGDAELVVAQQGAHIVRYTRAGQPLIWENPQATFRRGTPIRGGMPICWPWFGNLHANPPAVQAMRRGDTPAKAHGEVRARDWQLLAAVDAGEAMQLTLVLPEADGQLPDWPHSVALTLEIRLGDRLQVTLSTRNTGTDEVAYSQALHTYFAVSDVRQIHIEGLDGARWTDNLGIAQGVQRQAGDLHITAETDRIYVGVPKRLSIVDPGWNRRIELETTGSDSAVLWNPWIDKTRTFSDMDPDGWKGMVCIETANVLSDVVTLQLGESHVTGVSLWATPLA